jgi:bifunctional non-homologous end joining protein LigD
MTPKDERLAVMVEDHPLECGTLEGIIPAGLYGAGPFLVWDSGEYELISRDMEKGKFEFLLKGEKLMGSFVLTKLRGKDKDWLMIKKGDGYARPSYEMESMLTDTKLESLGEKVPPCYKE